MKIELIYDDEGNLMVVDNGEVSYHYCEYNLPEEVESLLKKIPCYSE